MTRFRQVSRDGTLVRPLELPPQAYAVPVAGSTTSFLPPVASVVFGEVVSEATEEEIFGLLDGTAVPLVVAKNESGVWMAKYPSEEVAKNVAKHVAQAQFKGASVLPSAFCNHTLTWLAILQILLSVLKFRWTAVAVNFRYQDMTLDFSSITAESTPMAMCLPPCPCMDFPSLYLTGPCKDFDRRISLECEYSALLQLSVVSCALTALASS